jgi:hypothetical protein
MGNALGVGGLVYWTSLAMKASSYFTDGEIELVMGIIARLLTDEQRTHAAGDQIIELNEKIKRYFGEKIK